MMTDVSTAITNLLYRYGELMDAGDLASAADLFKTAQIRMAGHEGLQDNGALLLSWQRMIRLYPCGTPRTKHLITNPIIETDGDVATCRSCYTVLQSTESFPLQIIASGRYHDRFERAEGKWRFIYRDYTLLDLQGDLSRHLDMPLLAEIFPKSK